jgi:hypothetical protein
MKSSPALTRGGLICGTVLQQLVRQRPRGGASVKQPGTILTGAGSMPFVTSTNGIKLRSKFNRRIRHAHADPEIGKNPYHKRSRNMLCVAVEQCCNACAGGP